jgi:hypothetical protein
MSTYPYTPVKLAENQGWIVRDARDGSETVETYDKHIAAYNRARSLKANDDRRRKDGERA